MGKAAATQAWGSGFWNPHKNRGAAHVYPRAGAGPRESSLQRMEAPGLEKPCLGNGCGEWLEGTQCDFWPSTRMHTGVYTHKTREDAFTHIHKPFRKNQKIRYSMLGLVSVGEND